MGFTGWTGIAFLILIVLAVLAFIKKIIKTGLFLCAVILAGLLILGYLWVHSPM